MTREIRIDTQIVYGRLVYSLVIGETVVRNLTEDEVRRIHAATAKGGAR